MNGLCNLLAGMGLTLFASSIDPLQALADTPPPDCAASIGCLMRGECIPADDGCRQPLTAQEFSQSFRDLQRLASSWSGILTSPDVALCASKQLLEQGRVSEATELLRAALLRDPAPKPTEKLNAAMAEAQKALQKAPSGAHQPLDVTITLQRQIVDQIITDQATVSLRTSMEFLPDWHTDRYDDTHHYQDAKRGKVYALVKEINVSALKNQNNPALPQLAIYRLKGEKLVFLDRLAWAMYEWERHATYIGLEPDYGNDFAYSSDVSFTAAVQIPESALDDTLVLVAHTTPCVRRFTRSVAPTVQYRPTSCRALPRSLPANGIPGSMKILGVAK